MNKNVLISILLLTSPLFLVALLLTNLFYTCPNIYVLLFSASVAVLIAYRLHERLSREGLAVKILLVFLSILTLLGFLVILGSYSSARSMGADTPLKQIVSNIRAEAEVYRDANGSYANFCTSEAMVSAEEKLGKQYIRIQTKCYGPILRFFLGVKEPAFKPTCNANAVEYAVDSYLLREQKYFCVDYTGQAKSSVTSIGDKSSCGE
jgi:hypothetical protein